MDNSFPKSAMTISEREWRLHGALFILTSVTTTLAGVALAAPDFTPTEPPLAGLLDYLLYLPLSLFYYCVDLVKYALTHQLVLGGGIAFSVSLLAILFS